MAASDKEKQLKKELRQLRKQYDFLVAALDNLPNPIFMKDEEAKFLFFNKRYAEAFGMKREEYVGKSVLDLEYLPPVDRERYQEEDTALIRSGEEVSYEKDFDFADGEVHPSLYWSKGVHDPVSGAQGLIGEIVDISKERHLRESLNESLEKLRLTNLKLEEMNKIDAGTGVYNRTLLNKKSLEMTYRKSRGESCALMADLDHFKRVNDLYGHIKGDEVLSQFAEILKSECREKDVPIRYGGEEFLLFLNDASLESGLQVAERIRARCEKEIRLPDGDPITVSIGVALMDAKKNLQDNIRRLDDNLYLAKHRGRNRVVAEEG
ncbi:MAG: diguanylate cyclase [Lachnospiraceae bacterium]|nr:diguanylate cyclase [Lachnospiraceae bacterium]